ncbi:YfhO family protein [Arthrobacter sp. SPG23]|uniref:YfhO family protein n=1 Tax=Arthrobacter sp. SPG23 TaxID=1610703 RepID=UPI0011848FAC|nr:YfhO family protein [Arthrobacter sp. SPG23]
MNIQERPTAARTGNPGWLWALATPVATILAALVPVIFNHRFYFYDDTQIGAYPIWREIGEMLRSGQWPFFSAEGWQAGNYAAEGQWGIFSPLTLGIGLASTFFTNALVFSTLVKVALLATASIGIYLVSRNLGTRAPWAFVAGVASTLAGFTVYLDSPSWVTGLMVWAFLPFVWWSLRRMCYQQKSPLPVLVSGYFLVTVGYVHGTIMMVLLFVAVIVELLVRRKWKPLVKTVSTGVLLGLVALAVYLPGVLTLRSTARTQVVANTNFLTVDLTGLAGSALPSNLPQVASWWWGPFAPAPLTYIAWFLPLFALVNFRQLRRLTPGIASVPVFLLLSLMLTLAPSDLGPLRTPVRLMPYVCLATIVLLCVALSLARVRKVSGVRWVSTAAVFIGSVYLGWTGKPELWTVSARMVLIMAVGFALTAVALRLIRAKSKADGVVAAVLVATSLALAFPQHYYFPNPPVQDFKLPADTSKYSTQLSGAKGQAVVVGTPSALDPSIWTESLVGNMWYLNPGSVHNLYSPIQNAAYSKDLCIASRGETCKELSTKLFEIDPTSGKPLADLLRVDTVQIVRDAADPNGAELAKAVPPSGWSVASRTPNTVMWTRNVPLGSVGAPVYASEGTEIEPVSNSSSQVTFKVDEVPASGGTVTLGRIAWPGYTADGATIVDPLRGYLLTVNVAPDMAGKTVTVSFQPPGWTLEIASLAAALLLGAAWSVVHALRGRRRSGSPDGPSSLADRPAGNDPSASAPHPSPDPSLRSGGAEPEYALRKEDK